MELKTFCGLMEWIFIFVVMNILMKGYYQCIKEKVLNQDYQNPKATIQIIGGAAGNKEGTSDFAEQPPWSAFRSSKYSIGHLTIFNNTHAYWDQVLPDGTILDQMWVSTTHHGPFSEIQEKISWLKKKISLFL